MRDLLGNTIKVGDEVEYFISGATQHPYIQKAKVLAIGAVTVFCQAKTFEKNVIPDILISTSAIQRLKDGFTAGSGGDDE